MTDQPTPKPEQAGSTAVPGYASIESVKARMEGLPPLSGESSTRIHTPRTQTYISSGRLAGYALAKALREDADDCPRPDRAQLMRRAAEEIECLIVEAREKAHIDKHSEPAD